MYPRARRRGPLALLRRVPRDLLAEVEDVPLCLETATRGSHGASDEHDRRAKSSRCCRSSPLSSSTSSLLSPPAGLFEEEQPRLRGRARARSRSLQLAVRQPGPRGARRCARGRIVERPCASRRARRSWSTRCARAQKADNEFVQQRCIPGENDVLERPRDADACDRVSRLAQQVDLLKRTRRNSGRRAA